MGLPWKPQSPQKSPRRLSRRRRKTTRPIKSRPNPGRRSRPLQRPTAGRWRSTPKSKQKHPEAGRHRPPLQGFLDPAPDQEPTRIVRSKKSNLPHRRAKNPRPRRHQKPRCESCRKTDARATAGAARPSAPTVPNGAKPANVNGTSGKRPASNTANGAKPKPAAAAARTLTSTAPKPGPSATSKPVGAAASKPTRTASGVSAPRASKPTVTTAKTAAATAVRAAVTKTAAAPPAGRTAVTQPAKAAAAAKKDVGRPPAAAAAKKPAGASARAPALPAARKQEASKPAAASKTSAVPKVSTAARAAETKSKPPPPAKPAATKKPAAAGRFPPANKPLLSQTPPASPASKPAKSSTPKAKGGAKPVQPVAPFSSTKTTPAAVSAPAAPEAADEPAAAAEAAAPSPQEPPQTASPSEEAPTLQSAAPALPTPEQSASAPPPDPHVIDKAPPTSPCPPPAPSAVTQTAPAANLNEEEEEEEKEGSQLVSVSEMSGTTQPTEESRPGSAGPVGASAWRAGGALLSELDSEDVSGSQQGASELSAPGVLEGTESMDDLGDGSLKGAMDMEGASAGSPDFEKVPDIPVIDFDEDEDDSDRVCDMDVGSEKTDEPRRPRHDNDVDEEDDDDDVEMASEGVTESGLESYGNADEDDFAEDERLDNLNREAPPPPPPQLPSAPAAQWDQPNPFVDPWAEPLCLPAAAEPLLGDCVAPPPAAAQAWSDAASFDPDKQNAGEAAEKCQSGNLNSESSTPEDDLSRDGKLRPPGEQADAEEGDKEEEPEPETLPADEVLGGPATAPTSAPSSSSTTEDEASDTEGEAQLEDSLVAAAVMKMKIDGQPLTQRCLSTVEEAEEAVAAEDATPPSAASPASFGFDSATTPSNSNAQSTGESCVRSPGIFSLEELSEEAKEPPAEQQYMECRKQDGGAAEEASEEGPDPPPSSQNPEENPENAQPQYYSAICEKTDDSLAALLPRRRDPAPLPRTHYDTVKLPDTPRLTCADLPPRSPARQGASPQLRRLEQHQRQLLELQHRREQQSRPLEEAEQERKRRVEEEERRKKEEAEEEIKRNKEEEEQRRELELQLQQQQQELQQRQQIMQWQQELQQVNKGQAALLSPSSGLCTIYEALESSEEEEQEEQKRSSSPSPPDSTLSSSDPSQEEDVSPEPPPSALDLDWGQKVDIVQQLINQTLLLNGDGCSCLLPLPGGAGGTLSPLESSLWPALLPPLTPPSATVTSVSSFSPDATGSAAQGEWTVVELETHH
ncbi:hypothetical protein OJAV_G00010850 [Oryzias javanicus]|uniref:BTB/POZ domain-containing protein n=1 Tax=Oryzias javanicus TaxID=123683 RepID=A0A3S2MX14_ORYJA|nr:hypothetical protein OJAV_G00010850 [Oryzias javanicus]